MKIILLTRGYFCVVDDEDYDRVNAMQWYARIHRINKNTKAYAERNGEPDENGKRKPIRKMDFADYA